MNIHELHCKGSISFGNKAKANLTRVIHPSSYIHFTPAEFPPVEWVTIFGVPCLYKHLYIYSDTIYNWWVLKFESQSRNLDTLYFFIIKWTASSEFGTYRLCEQRRFRRACASAQSRQNLRCSLIQAVNQEELSDRKPDPWSLWMAGHAQLKFVMTECSKTQIRLTGLK